MTAGANAKRSASQARSGSQSILGRAFTNATRRANRRVLPAAERLLPSNPGSLAEHPPVFVVGAPRCGSTLFAQVITRSLEVSYLSNRHASFYGAPGIVERLARPKPQESGPLKSFHGVTAGPAGPSECGEWWYRFFPRYPPHVVAGQIGTAQRQAFARSLIALTTAANRPVFFKNLYASFRIQEILTVVPHARFVVLSRSEIEQGHSLLEARRSLVGSYDQWWSMRPPESEDLDHATAAVQVIEQIRRILEMIDRDLLLMAAPESQILRLSYEEFCDRPTEILATVNAFMNTRLRPGALDALPPRFSRRSDVRIPAYLFEELETYANTSGDQARPAETIDSARFQLGD